jgi:hypothetical protein
MKYAAFFVLVAALGCASLHDDGPPVAIRLAPLDNRIDLFSYRGPIVLRYAVEVDNASDQTVILRSLDLQSTEGGAYTLRTDATPMNVKVAPKATGSFSIQIYGRSRGGIVSSPEPVVIRGKAVFDSPKGSFVKIFVTNILPGA